MIQTATLSRTVPLHPRASAAKSGGESGDFAGALEQVSDEAKPDPYAAAPEDDPRQDDAATGNALPLPVITPDAAFIWQPIIATPAKSTPPRPAPSTDGLIVVGTGALPTITQRAMVSSSQTNVVAPTTKPTAPTTPTPTPTPIGAQAPLPPGPTQAGGTPAMQLAAAVMGVLPPVKPSAPVTTMPAADIQASDAQSIIAPRWSPTDPVPIAPAVSQPDIVQPQPGTVASAAMVFGAAIRAATTTRDDPDRPAAPSDTPLTPIGAAAIHEIKVADAQQAPLDMRQDRWPHAMIERIEMLRDAADAVDTRIRLVPDALGAIDVSVKTDGDTVRVHFNAEQAATRTLLADAQPRLAELAEARGLKLAQGSLGDGGAQQQRAPATPQTPNRPAPASAVIADTATDDTRIA